MEINSLNVNFIKNYVMKIKLLLSLLTLPTIGFAQSPINSFYTNNNVPYILFTSASALNHGTGGANQTWSFNGLVALGTSVITNVDPIASETTTYPGTTKVIVTTTTQGTTTTTGKMFTKNTAANSFSITGLNATDLDINFATNNATLGVFPMVYGYTNTDSNVAGNYTYTTYSGTFTGTLTTSVDAYGTLSLPDLGFTSTVTRLKTVLNISMNYGFFSNIGTVTQTSYSYYSASNPMNSPEFRTINTVAVVPLLSINQDDTSIEKYNGVQLANSSSELQSVWIQNPIQNNIEIYTSNGINNAKIRITDMLGKTVYQTNDNTISGSFEIPVSLTKGMYLITIGNESGSITKKIVKS